jgi:hypothetical protein
MRCFAKLFCGRILLTRFKHYLTAIGSARASVRQERYQLDLEGVRSMNTTFLTDVNARYRKVRSLLDQLEHLHKAFYRDEPVDLRQAYDLYTAIQTELAEIMSRKSIPASKMAEMGGVTYSPPFYA